MLKKSKEIPKEIKIIVFGADQMDTIDYSQLADELYAAAKKEIGPGVPLHVEGWGISRYSLLRAVSDEIVRQAEQDRLETA